MHCIYNNRYLHLSFIYIHIYIYQENPTAQTGKPQPNMSTTFIGKSSPEEDLCKQTPRSQDPIDI